MYEFYWLLILSPPKKKDSVVLFTAIPVILSTDIWSFGIREKPWELTNTALQNGHGSAVIDTAVYSIRWGHKLAGLASPVDHPIVTSAAEGARRRLTSIATVIPVY